MSIKSIPKFGKVKATDKARKGGVKTSERICVEENMVMSVKDLEKTVVELLVSFLAMQDTLREHGLLAEAEKRLEDHIEDYMTKTRKRLS